MGLGINFPSLTVGAGMVSFDLSVCFWYMEALIVKILMGFLMISCRKCWIKCLCVVLGN